MQDENVDEEPEDEGNDGEFCEFGRDKKRGTVDGKEGKIEEK